jgi:hypothetical protein
MKMQFLRAYVELMFLCTMVAGGFAAERATVSNHRALWQPKPPEFPRLDSTRLVRGELVSVDFIHRAGEFRASGNGELVDFVLPPYGNIHYLNAEADLRDLPLGCEFQFSIIPDARGGVARVLTMQDQFTLDANHNVTYRLEEVKAPETRIVTTRHGDTNQPGDSGKQEWLASTQTRVWRGEQQVKIDGLAAGEELLCNLTAETRDHPAECTDIWVGANTHQLATEQQRKKYIEFTKFRGLPGWVEKSETNSLKVTLFSGDASNFQKRWMNDFVVGKEIQVVVANEELRTWNPPVDNERGTLLAIEQAPTDGYGSSGVRLVFTVRNMLEGFRKGRVVRVFGKGWPVKDPFYGESLMNYGYSRIQTSELLECVAKEYPEQFPFRTDYGNAGLPWYQLKPSQTPPRFSEHLAFGEIVQVDAAARSGRFRQDRTGEIVDYTLIPEGSVRYLNADASLGDLPTGIRCRFHLYQDEKGAFTRASLVSDEFSFLASNLLTYRVETMDLAEGAICAARQIPEVQNYNGDMEKPPDIGRRKLSVTPTTRVWKGDQAAKLSDLAIGDALLVNLTGEQTTPPSRCTDIWIGTETHKLAASQQSKRNAGLKK